MTTMTNGGWVADLETMSCRNTCTRMVVEFYKTGKNYIGKIKDIHIEVIENWSKLWYGDYLIKNAVMQAEEVFLKDIKENDITNMNTMTAV
jgi:hypothetical protein